MQINKDIVVEIYPQSQFTHQIKDGKRNCEPINKTKKKILESNSENWISITYNNLDDSCRFKTISMNFVATILALKG